jgi:hypothetical protein
MVQRNKIYECIHGSNAYGLATPTSDVDKKGIFIPDKEYYFGMKEIEQQMYGPDHTLYALKKFVKLARDCNPNIIEILFCDFSDILFISKPGVLLRDNRHLFLSKKAKFTFSGYAFSQLQRIKGHHSWIMFGGHEPKPEDFQIEKSRKDSQGNNLLYTSFQEEAYKQALSKWHQYLDWKKNRNPLRSKLEEQFGYDTKHAMHLVRLLRMGREILSEGEVKVKRPDREELLAIRNGAWTYEHLLQEAEAMEKDLDIMYEKSNLPHTPDDKAIDKLLIQMTEEFLHERQDVV